MYIFIYISVEGEATESCTDVGLEREVAAAFIAFFFLSSGLTKINFQQDNEFKRFLKNVGIFIPTLRFSQKGLWTDSKLARIQSSFECKKLPLEEVHFGAELDSGGIIVFTYSFCTYYFNLCILFLSFRMF